MEPWPERCRRALTIFLPAPFFSRTRSPFVRGQLCTGAGRCRISVRFASGNLALGVLRPLGDGGQRSLVCSFCLAEWEFRRIVCPACGEENHAKLPVYTADELKHVRVEACDSCRSYIKTVDMTKSGRAEPVVDEMAAIPLDLWAAEQGYAKLQLNLLQL